MNEEKLINVTVIKRDGKKVTFDGTKIAIAIKKGFDSIEGKYTEFDTNKVYEKVIKSIIDSNVDRIKIEEIQDIIELKLRECGYEDVYESFSNYREKRAQSREIFFEEKRKHKFLKALEKIGLSTKTDGGGVSTANKNSNELLQDYGRTISQEFATSYLMRKRFADSHEYGAIHINDIEFYPMGTTESTQINLERLFQDGFSTESSSMREPQNIYSYSMLAIIAIAFTQKDQHGEESIPAFDYYMAPGVLKTFKKEFRRTIYEILEYTDYDKFIAINGIEREIDKLNTICFDISDFYRFTREADSLKRLLQITYNRALRETQRTVSQAMEAFVHNLNSLCNEKVTTINLGTDTSSEGRMITKEVLKAIGNGLGENKKAISPKVVFKVKEGINFNEKDPNYDLLEYAAEQVKNVDNIAFSFLDSSFNSQFYKEGDYDTEIAYFEDGTRVMDNFLDADKAVSSGRGVLSTTTVNLVRIALKHRDDEKAFYEELDQKLELIKDQLLERMDIQENKKINNFPFLLQQNVWIDSERIKEDDKVRKSLKQGVLRVGYIGINEAVKLLTGGENAFSSPKAEKLQLKIIEFMRTKIDDFVKKHNLNFTLATDTSEETAREFLDFDSAIFGKVKGITDKEKYDTNFSEYKNINNDKKIKFEAKIQELTNGGHKAIICSKDIMGTIRKMHDEEIGLGKIIYCK